MPRPEPLVWQLGGHASITLGFVLAFLGGCSPTETPSRRGLIGAAIPSVPTRNCTSDGGKSAESGNLHADVRRLTITVATDAEFRSVANWRRTLQNDINFVSSVFSSQLQVELEPLRWVDWDSGRAASTVQQLLDRASASVGCGATDIVMAISGKQLPATSQTWNPERGCAGYYGQHALIRCANDGDDMTYRRETMLHELCHLFGAWHSSNVDSVMRLHPCGAEVHGFDPTTLEILRRWRRRDFHQDVESLGEDDIKVISQLFSGSHVPGEMHPVSNALAKRAAWWLQAGNTSAAELNLELAVKLSADVDGAGEPTTKSLVAALCKIREDARTGGVGVQAGRGK